LRATRGPCIRLESPVNITQIFLKTAILNFSRIGNSILERFRSNSIHHVRNIHSSVVCFYYTSRSLLSLDTSATSAKNSDEQLSHFAIVKTSINHHVLYMCSCRVGEATVRVLNHWQYASKLGSYFYQRIRVDCAASCQLKSLSRVLIWHHRKHDDLKIQPTESNIYLGLAGGAAGEASWPSKARLPSSKPRDLF